MTKNDGGPAFPEAFWPTPQSDAPDYRAGMSLRDWFAGQALTSLVGKTYDKVIPSADFAIGAYGIADAMLAERSKS